MKTQAVGADANQVNFFERIATDKNRFGYVSLAAMAVGGVALIAGAKVIAVAALAVAFFAGIAFFFDRFGNTSGKEKTTGLDGRVSTDAPTSFRETTSNNVQRLETTLPNNCKIVIQEEQDSNTARAWNSQEFTEYRYANFSRDLSLQYHPEDVMKWLQHKETSGEPLYIPLSPRKGRSQLFTDDVSQWVVICLKATQQFLSETNAKDKTVTIYWCPFEKTSFHLWHKEELWTRAFGN